MSKETTGHVHAWEPVPLHDRQYRCACGATGYKKIFPGEYNPNHPHARVGDIIPHAAPREYGEDVTVHLMTGKHAVDGLGGNYQKGKLPASGGGPGPPRLVGRKRKK